MNDIKAQLKESISGKSLKSFINMKIHIYSINYEYANYNKVLHSVASSALFPSNMALFNISTAQRAAGNLACLFITSAARKYARKITQASLVTLVLYYFWLACRYFYF